MEGRAELTEMSAVEQRQLPADRQVSAMELLDARPPADRLLVARMRAAGAIAVGKTNTPELGAGSHTFNPLRGVTRNPGPLEHKAGGSSGGAAAALACRMVAVADGSDMGGSLRNPAACNDVVGLRPTARVVPKVGPGNAWSPLAVDGPMGRTPVGLHLVARHGGVVELLRIVAMFEGATGHARRRPPVVVVPS